MRNRTRISVTAAVASTALLGIAAAQPAGAATPTPPASISISCTPTSYTVTWPATDPVSYDLGLVDSIGFTITTSADGLLSKAEKQSNSITVIPQPGRTWVRATTTVVFAQPAQTTTSVTASVSCTG